MAGPVNLDAILASRAPTGPVALLGGREIHFGHLTITTVNDLVEGRFRQAISTLIPDAEERALFDDVPVDAFEDILIAVYGELLGKRGGSSTNGAATPPASTDSTSTVGTT